MLFVPLMFLFLRIIMLKFDGDFTFPALVQVDGKQAGREVILILFRLTNLLVHKGKKLNRNSILN